MEYYKACVNDGSKPIKVNLEASAVLRQTLRPVIVWFHAPCTNQGTFLEPGYIFNMQLLPHVFCIMAIPN
jgi:hypothetical protein